MGSSIPVADLALQETVFSPSVDTVQLNLGLLYERVKRLSAVSVREDYVCWMTYFEMIVVQLRALCCDGRWRQKNYTIQGLLFRLGDSDAANEFERFMNETIVGELNGEQISLNGVIKRIADKFVCHYECGPDSGGSSVLIRQRDALIKMFLNGNLLYMVVSKIKTVVDKALSDAEKKFKCKIIEQLFGSVAEYERIIAQEIPRI